MLLSLVLSLVPHAAAFAPTDTSGAVEPARVWRYSPVAQARLAHQPDWVEFTQGEGAGWLARFDERTGTVHSAWGPGVEMGPIADEAAAEAALRAFIQRNRGVFGDVVQGELRLNRANFHKDTWYLGFDRLVNGVPIYRAGVDAVIKQGRLIQFSADVYPGITREQPEIDAAAAIEAAQLDGPAALAEHTDLSAQLVLVPWEDEAGFEMILAWEVHSTTTEPAGRWVTFVSARTGEWLRSVNTIRTMSGTVSAMVHPRTVYEDLTERVTPLIRVTGNSGAQTYANNSGVYALESDSAGSVTLHGSYIDVDNAAGSDGSMSLNGDATWTDANASQAELDTYVFLHDVRNWCLDLSLGNDMCTDALTANVNMSDSGTCNAYYDGNVNFFAAGGGCSNTGEIADVVYHEWGHGFHAYGANTWYVDGSVGEGVGDTVAALQTLDPVLAPGFYNGSTSGIRECSEDHVYPDDVIGEVHEDGLIFAGAAWDVRLALSDTYGEAEDVKGTAWEVASRLLADAVPANFDIPGSYDAYVAADDDDGDLGNGTPHLCELIESFALHGLGPGGDGGGLVTIDHEALGNQPANTVIPLTGSVTAIAPECFDVNLDTAQVKWSTDGGATWDSAVLTAAGDRFTGEIPAQGNGTIVQYYLEISSDDGASYTLPTVGEIAPYTFYVGELQEVWCSDFEDGEEGFTHELLDGNEQDGADDWMWDKPEPSETDPDGAFSGSYAWGNDLGGRHGGNTYNGDYQPSVTNRLTSIGIDTSGHDSVIVQYRRWLNVEDGYYDVATLYANEAPIWQNHATSKAVGDEDTLDQDWILHTLRVDAPGDSLSLAWELDSDGGKELGGWTIDDVCVYAAVGDVDPGPSDTGDGGTDSDDSTLPPDGKGEVDTGIELAPSACGCAVSPGGSTAGLAGLLGLAALARRRRG